MINSINTNLAAYYAQQNINIANNAASSSVARLSSGNRIVRSSDDVAALAAGTSLRTNVTTLKMALINTSQGSSLLQVADGALSQITDILQRQKAIAVQAGSGSLTDTDRGFLNQEFQALVSEIDRLTGNTNFNGVKLIDGSLSEAVTVDSNTDLGAKATASIGFLLNATAGQTLILNGQTVTIQTGATAAQVERGLTLQQTLDNLVTFLNAAADNTALTQAQRDGLSQASYARVGNSLVITQRSGGSIGEMYRIDPAGTWTAAANAATVSGQGGERTNQLGQAVTIATIDTDAIANGTKKFAAGVLTVDGATVYTVVANDSLRNIVNGINANTATTGITAYITGETNNYRLNVRSSNSGAAMVVAGAGLGTYTSVPVAANTVQYLDGGTNSGLGSGRTVGRGTVGNNVLTDQTQVAANVRISFPEIADADLLTTTNFGTLRFMDIEGVRFSFTTVAAANKAQTEITIGSTLAETLDNAVAAINSFSGSSVNNYAFQQIEAVRDGTSIVLRKKDVGNAQDITAGTFDTTASLMTGGSVSAAAINNGITTGVTTTGVTNEDFVGTIGGMTATFTGTANRVNLSITVGGKTYTANNVTTNPTGATNPSIRLTSQDGGGYFDISLRANSGSTVSDAASASTYADRINAALAGLTFYQKRSVSSYTGNAPILTGGVTTGSLIGTSVDMQLNDFSSVDIDSIEVNAPFGVSKNGSIAFTINGERFVSAATVGNQLGAYSITRFTSETDSDRFVEFKAGATAISFSTDERAAAFEEALRTAFGVGDGSAAVDFQIGVRTEDTLSVSIGNATTDKLYAGRSLDVLTQASSAEASDVLDEAIAMVSSIRADVGALQSRFNFAASNVESAIQNQDAARGVLLDTDVAAESTAYATAQVKLQAGISVLAQANQLQQSLLKLIG